MKKIPYYNGEPHYGPYIHTYDHTIPPLDPRQTSDRRWYKHHQPADADFTDLSLRTTKDDALFWLRTR